MAIPAAPAVRVRNRPSNGIIEVRITAVAGAVSYQLYRDTHALATSTRGSSILAAAIGDPIYDAVTPGTVYWYRVKATNVDGTSPFGTEVNLFAANYSRDDPDSPSGVPIFMKG